MRILLPALAVLLGLPAAAIAAEGGAGFKTVTVVLYQPDEVLRNRVPSIEMLADFLKRLERVCSEFFDRAKTPEILDVVVAIKPGRRLRIWFVSPSRRQRDEQLNLLRQALEAVEAPDIRNGPVAVAILGAIAGAQRKVPDPKAFAAPIPKEWKQAMKMAGRGIVPDDVLRVVWPE